MQFTYKILNIMQVKLCVFISSTHEFLKLNEGVILLTIDIFAAS